VPVVLAPRAAKHEDLSRIRSIEPLTYLYGCGLPGPVGSKEAEALASKDLEIEAVYGDYILVRLTEISNLKSYVCGFRLHRRIITPPAVGGVTSF